MGTESPAIPGQLRGCAPPWGTIMPRQATMRSTTVTTERISSGSSAEPSMRAFSNNVMGSNIPWKSNPPPEA